MNGGDEKLARLMAELKKAVVGQELHRYRSETRRPQKGQQRATHA